MGLRQPHHLQFHARRDHPSAALPSVLFQTLDAKFSEATWELQFQKAAAVWQAVANINLSQVSDNGSPEATNGNQQDDPRFGDIRIGAVNLGTGALGETFLPPPFNGGTDAGDMFLNSAMSWQINSSTTISKRWQSTSSATPLAWASPRSRRPACTPTTTV